jgi:hypothetical protein
MLDLLPATAEDVAALSHAINLLSETGLPDWLVQGKPPTGETVKTVVMDGRRVATYWCWFSRPNGCLVINAAASLVHEDVGDPLFAGMRRYADQVGARRIEFTTARRGLALASQRYGFRPDGLRCSLNLEEVSRA